MIARIFLYAILLFAFGRVPHAFAYEKAVESKEVVLNKMYPKEGRVELGLKGGFVLNSSYLNTFLAGGSVSYFFNEVWGFNAEGFLAVTSDKSERECIENFYNDPNFQVAAECGPADNLAEDGTGKANFGPAYVPIRELNMIFSVNALWNPLYGKQIVLLSGVGHFDLFVALGGGIAQSTFYPLTKELKNSGNTSRGAFPEDGATGNTPGTKDTSEVGIEGRPVPLEQTNVLAHFNVGQRFHFAKRMMLLAELNNYTLLGTESGFDNFFSLIGGFGIRF